MYFLPSDPFIEAQSIQPLATRFLKNKTLPYRLRLIQNNYRGAAGGGDIAVICCAQEDGADIFHLTFSFLLFTIRTLWIFLYVNDAQRKWSPFERCCSATTAQGGQVGGGEGGGDVCHPNHHLTHDGPEPKSRWQYRTKEKKKKIWWHCLRGGRSGGSIHDHAVTTSSLSLSSARLMWPRPSRALPLPAVSLCRSAVFESSHRQIGIMRQEIRLNLTSIKDSISNVNNRKPDSPMWIIAQQRGIFSNAK